MSCRGVLTLVCVGLWLTGCAGAIERPSGSRQTKIDYIPLSLTTYTAVTRDNIEKEGSCRISTDAERMEWISSLAGQADQKTFDKNNVRVKIQLADDVYFVDSGGSFLMPDGQVVFSLEARNRLTAILEELRKSSTCTRYDWLDD